jgi:hypothetical protein
VSKRVFAVIGTSTRVFAMHNSAAWAVSHQASRSTT